ncbi:MAG TPA: site-specific integrase [Verrucomicrobiae bacterium]|nr:site-specific integrase [Verrucomicrobiae bacterium]
MRATSNGAARFSIAPFTNPVTGTQSWRVAGYKLDGSRIRENYAEEKAARCRQIELETESLARQSETNIRATKLSETQLRLAETVFIKLDDEADILRAVDYWLKHAKDKTVEHSPRLDEAWEAFAAWLKTTEEMRHHSKRNLQTRVAMFVNATANAQLQDITKENVRAFLDKRSVGATTKDNDRRAISRFFAWCMEDKRNWLKSNPAHYKTKKGEKPPPVILSLDECERLLAATKKHKRGALVPYVSVCLFGGLRPFEAARLSWDRVNLSDDELRVESVTSKGKRTRVIKVCPTLKRWLLLRKDKPFFPTNWRNEFDAIKRKVGFGTSNKDAPHLKPWVQDIMRHTATSHYFRKTGSYGETAEQMGNSEAIIKKHYASRVTTDEMKKFYALKP